MMRKLFIFTAAAVPLLSDRAHASVISSLADIPVLINLIILIGSVACLVTAIKLFTLVKGGALARGWQFLVVSFVTLAFGQIIVLAEKLGWFALTFDMAGFLYLATVVLWLIGLMQTRRVLG